MRPFLLVLSLLVLSEFTAAQEAKRPRLELTDVFDLEWASDPRLAPDGTSIVYVRNFMDIMKDRRRSSLWTIRYDGSEHRPLTSGGDNHAAPRWSPDGKRLLYTARVEDGTQVFVRWMDTGQAAQLTRLRHAPSGLTWSPDGASIAFSMFVPKKTEPFAKLPSAPVGAQWAPAPKVIDKLHYRSDGRGYAAEGFRHLFVLPAEGGTPRQVTTGDFDHEGAPAWMPDGRSLVFSANRRADAAYDPLNSEIYRVDLVSGAIDALTDRAGPDRDPVVSPDGTQIAYLGFADRLQGYQVTRLSVMNADGSASRELTAQLDRSVRAPSWTEDGEALHVLYDDHGKTVIARVGLDGSVEPRVADVGGTSIGRPYASGSFTAVGGRLAYTRCDAGSPADVATDGGRLTDLNRDVLGHRQLGRVEERTFESSHDGRAVQAWVVTPVDFDASSDARYPLILEIHGGPFANYGPRFAVEMQLYAAAGYVVLYVNPRGSTSYGEEFGNLIHHAYPGHDYDDLMSAVDGLIAGGNIDPKRLFVTGGSGGGVLTSWIVGKTERFRAAVVAKPVINWESFALTADRGGFFYRYWFPGLPWEFPEHYRSRSPLSLVGNVRTPTMLLTGEADYRTPISESEQYYQALKLRRVETALVRIPEASHGIAERPSHLIAKVAHVLEWFARHGGLPRR